MTKINWDVIWSLGRTLLVAGGPVTALLIAMGFPPVQVSEWMGIGLAAIGVLSVAVPGVVAALKQTDRGKANTIERLDPAGKAAVLDKLPDETKIAAVAHIPEVQKIVVDNNAGDGVAKAVADQSLPNVITQADDKKE